MGKVIFVVGRSGSGKTTICKKLEEIGFFRISASEHLKKLYLSEFGSEPSRIQLANYGEMLLLQNRLEGFHLGLETQIGNRDAVCVDGLRFKASVDELSKSLQRSLLIFLECPPGVRESRSDTYVSRADFEALGSHETEVSVDAMRASADLIIDASKPIAIAFRELENGLRGLQFI